jgi:hypothetical protein
MDNLLCSGAEKKDPVHEEATHMKRTTSPWPYLPLAAFILSLYAGAVQARVDLHYGTPVDMGNGTIRTYIAFNAADAPIEIGILMSGDSFDGLPSEPSTTGRCFDLNGNGSIDAKPSDATRRSPFCVSRQPLRSWRKGEGLVRTRACKT